MTVASDWSIFDVFVASATSLLSNLATYSLRVVRISNAVGDGAGGGGIKWTDGLIINFGAFVVVFAIVGNVDDGIFSIISVVISSSSVVVSFSIIELSVVVISSSSSSLGDSVTSSLDWSISSPSLLLDCSVFSSSLGVAVWTSKSISTFGASKNILGAIILSISISSSSFSSFSSLIGVVVVSIEFSVKFSTVVSSSFSSWVS